MASTAWLGSVHRGVHAFLVPPLCALAVGGNALVLAVVLASNRFSRASAPVVRLFYVALAVADLLSVLLYYVPLWFGAPTLAALGFLITWDKCAAPLTMIF